MPREIMPLTIGSQLGSHEITALLGKGGMGEVYRARDLKLKREVAIKILPEEFSLDKDRVSRFQREAEVLASLNHPNMTRLSGLVSRPPISDPRAWDFAPDGKRILGAADLAEQTASGTLVAQQIHVILNWFSELQQRVPVK